MVVPNLHAPGWRFSEGFIYEAVPRLIEGRPQ
jgi:hypothetical protein